jgi:DNA repair protein RadD
MLDSMGIPAGVAHSEKSSDENDQAIADFKSGKLRALVNNNKLTTGFDFPGIDRIVMLRHTCSPGLWVQMLGRGTRPVYMDGYDLLTLEGRLAAILASHKQNCLVMDFAGNTERLGPINDRLIPAGKGKKGHGGIAPVKLCPTKGCNTYNHCSAKVCINCGFEFPQNVNFYAQASSKALIATSMPVVEVINVTKIIYTRNSKMDRPDSLLVTYYCGLSTRYKEWVCLEHGQFAGKRARDWWRTRAGDDVEPPITTTDALKQLSSLREPTQIRVWTNKKYPEIMSYVFEGEEE